MDNYTDELKHEDGLQVLSSYHLGGGTYEIGVWRRRAAGDFTSRVSVPVGAIVRNWVYEPVRRGRYGRAGLDNAVGVLLNTPPRATTGKPRYLDYIPQADTLKLAKRLDEVEG